MTQEQWQKLIEMAEAIKQELRGRGIVAFGGMETEDAVQDVLLKEWKATGRITSYLKRRMQHQANNKVWKKNDKNIHYPDDGLVNMPVEEDPVRQDILDILISMSKSPKVFSPRDLSIFVLRAQGESYTEIGEKFGLTHERVRQIQGKIVQRIRKMVDDDE